MTRLPCPTCITIHPAFTVCSILISLANWIPAVQPAQSRAAVSPKVEPARCVPSIPAALITVLFINFMPGSGNNNVKNNSLPRHCRKAVLMIYDQAIYMQNLSKSRDELLLHVSPLKLGHCQSCFECVQLAGAGY